MITRSFSKKNNNIYSHHDNDNDILNAKDITIIECVNDDCLAEIFMYVPACERPKIALVCKKWERALDYSWFNVKKLELTYWEYDEYPHFLVRNYPRINGQFKFLKSLLYKCGRYLTELDLSIYGYCNILPVINEYCQNLVKLRIRIHKVDNAKLHNAFSNLSKLEVLKIILHGCFDDICSQVSSTLIDSLLNVADTLTDLNISNWPAVLYGLPYFPDNMMSVIPQLKALRKFSNAGIGCPRRLRDYFKFLNNFKTVTCIPEDTCYMINKIGDEELIENIEELDIIGWRITDNGIYNIANTIKRLHTLSVSCQLLTDAGIVTCTKMNNLKYLEFKGFNNVTDSSIKLLKNLTHLTLPFSNKITDESAIKVLENSPDMIYYCVRDTGITHKFIGKAAEISRNREIELNIVVTLDPDQTEYEYLDIDYI
ncbi:uncharacterized protein LOC122858127 [Aphidius gifuensis]|uniref:uncharacterized protein LOC122858127 n=1 Tax=Aphidius gifuensis TaxID=684658 RepID=UPI001CDBE403|nr:uncharacterized protein LOC122858127 [Aphidius gifuensis]